MLTESVGREVVRFEAIPVEVGQRVTVSFEGVKSPWRQGVWLATEGCLVLVDGGVEAPQFVLWVDTAPPGIVLEIAETDGLLRLYNVWHSGRPGRRQESQGYTSGMLVEEVGPGMRRYRCNDVGYDPNFDKLVFTVAVH